MMDIIEDQLKEIAVLNEKNMELYKKIGKIQETLKDTENQVDAWKEKYNELLVECEHYKEVQINKTKMQGDEINRLGKELKLHIERENELKSIINSMEKSVSWKLTKPLRYLRWRQIMFKKFSDV